MSVVRYEGFPLRVHHSSIDPNCLGEQGEGRKKNIRKEYKYDRININDDNRYDQ